MSEKSINKVLLITPAINMGGMQNAMATLANGFIEQNVEVDMYALFKLEHFCTLNPKINFTESSYHPFAYNLITRIYTIIKSIREKAKESKADTIIVYGRFYSALTLVATLHTGKRVFISDRASSLYRDKWYVELVTKLIYIFIKPTGIIAQTSDSARFQMKKFGEKVPIEIIPNAVRDIKIYDSEKENIVLAVGRFGDKLKGFDRLIEAWGMVNAPGWKLVFAGGTADEDPQLTLKAKALGIYNSIDFLGKVKEMDSLYARSSIFVIPSRSEGFPNALVEALCAGVCCVAFDFIAGPRDIISHEENGIIVPDGDTKVLAKTLEYLIQNPSKRNKLSQKGLQSKSRFGKQQIIERTLEFISK